MLENLDIEALVTTYAVPWGIKIFLALLIFYIGRAVVNFVVRVIDKLMRGNGMDETLVGFLSSILRWVLLLFFPFSLPFFPSLYSLVFLYFNFFSSVFYFNIHYFPSSFFPFFLP